jgi:hypothetical protein
MNFDGMGLHPDNAMGIVLKLYDGVATPKERIDLLLHNRPLANLKSVDLPPNFASGKTIDLNASELLGLGAVASYYNWTSEEAGTGNTYQAFVGIEDSAKKQEENVLSDGAIWHDQAHAKMLIQQVMVQGYFPERMITDKDVAAQISKKAKRRSDYPNNCGLIVNIYSQSGELDLDAIRQDVKEDIAGFNDVFLVWYRLPMLDFARVMYMSEPTARNLVIQLRRNPMDDTWGFNYDGKLRGYKPDK